MQTEKVKVSDLIEYRFNAKVHPDWQIEQIKKSIEEYGYNTESRLYLHYRGDMKTRLNSVLRDFLRTAL